MPRNNEHKCPTLDGAGGYFLGFDIDQLTQDEIDQCKGSVEQFGRKVCPVFFEVAASGSDKPRHLSIVPSAEIDDK